MPSTDQPAVARDSRGGSAADVFVGRERELSELRAGLAGARAARGRLFLVCGEAGIGKTRLAEELSAEAVRAGAVALWGRCWEGGGAPAYWPWVQAIRAYLRDRDVVAITKRLGPAAVLLARLVPELPAEGSAADHGDTLEREQARFALFEATAALLREASAEAPLLVVLDDLHAADCSSLLLLKFVARELRDAAVLVVGTYREDETPLAPGGPDLLADLVRDGRRLPLGGLSAPEVGELIERRSGAQARAGLSDLVHRVTDGSPFLVEEVVRTLGAERRLAEPLASGVVPIPHEVRAAARARLAELASDARDALSTAAVIGREFALSTWREVCELEPDRLFEALGEASAAGVIREVPGAAGRYRFAHGLIRETLYGALPVSRRAALHRAIGETLERTHGAAPDARAAELAHHFARSLPAGDPQKAIEYAVQAGERAMRLHAYEEAAVQWERALEALELGSPDGERRCQLLLALGAARWRGGEVPAARETFGRAAALARELGDTELLASAALGYGAGLGGPGYVERPDRTLIGLLEEARDALGAHDSGQRVQVLARLATALHATGLAKRRAALAHEAVEMAERIGDVRLRIVALHGRCAALAGPDRTEERLADATALARLAEEAGDREMAFRGHHFRFRALLELGDAAGAEGALAACERIAQELRQPLYGWQARLARALEALAAGRLADAERLADEALSLGRRGQPGMAALAHDLQLLLLQFITGRIGRLEPRDARVAARFERVDESLPLAHALRAGYVLLLAQTGREPQARAALHRLSSAGFDDVPRDANCVGTLALIGLAALAVADVECARRVRELLAPYAERSAVLGGAIVSLGSAAAVLGGLADVAGRLDEAAELLEAGLERNVATRHIAFEAWAAARYAHVLRRRGGPGDAQRAGRLLERAREIAVATGVRDFSHGEDVAADDPAPGGSVVLRREGEYWVVAHGGSTVRLRHTKGLAYIARLIAHPNVEIAAADLVAAGGAPASAGAAAAVAAGDLRVMAAGQQDAGELLDADAKAAYQRRLEDLREELDEAERWADPERVAAAREEMDFLARELARAVGLGGRDRRAASVGERARVNATRAIKSALARVAEHDERLARYLRATIRTGTFCSYGPERAQRSTAPR